MSRRLPSAVAPAWLGVLDVALALSLIAAVWIGLSGGVHLPAIGLRASDPVRALVAAFALGLVRVLAAGLSPSPSAGWVRRCREAWISFWSARGDRRMGAYVVVSIVATWAALGPAWGLYTVFYRLFPGFDFIRVPSRLTLLSLLGLAVVAGFGVQKLGRVVQGTSQSVFGSTVLGVAVIAALTIEYAAFPRHVPCRDADLLSGRLDCGAHRGRSAGARAESLPEDEVSFARTQTVYMVYSTTHFRPMVNGYSGFIPSDQHRLLLRLSAFPSDEAIEALRRAGVRYVIVHRAGYTDSEWDGIVGRLETDPRLQRLHADESGTVLGLAPS